MPHLNTSNDAKTVLKNYANILKISIFSAPKLFSAGLTKLIKQKLDQPTNKEDNEIIDVATHWIEKNNAAIDALMPYKNWHINLPDGLKKDGQYLLICNHQSWVDTSVIQYISQNKLPLTRFFTKHQLIYLPIVGQAFYFLDFPMMKRKGAKHGASQKQNHDINEAKRACRLLQNKPFVLLNFLEGTRFNAQKHQAQQSPYAHLLKPKAGGFALVLASFGQNIDGILDATIVYKNGAPSYNDLWCGKVQSLAVDITLLDMDETLQNSIMQGGYYTDAKIKAQLYDYLDDVWQKKDAKIKAMLAMLNDNV